MSTLSVRPLRVGFIHPDLGIGGAERLVVDAAAGLQDLGHSVAIYTSHWDKDRCFAETADGSIHVQVLGNTLFPVSWKGKFHIVLAILRQLHLSFSLFWMTYFAKDWDPPDIYIVDQLSTCIPILRWLLRTRVVFYCHFPDLLLSPGRAGFQDGTKASRKSILRAIYRMPIDALEEATTCKPTFFAEDLALTFSAAQADRILVNSHFTARIFQETFPQVRRQLQIVYPGVHTDTLESSEKADESAVRELVGSHPLLLSINRFEPKKNAVLALEAFAAALKSGQVPKDLRLVLAGGFDTRVESCVTTLHTLERTADRLGLTHSTAARDAQVLFVTNLSEKQKSSLLRSKQTKALLYTPSFEHLGIGPLEAMACGLPVLAVNNGGPQETVVDGETGYLRASDRNEWSDAMVKLLSLTPEEREKMGEAGRQRVRDYFDVKVMSRGFEKAVKDIINESDSGKLPDIWQENALYRLLIGSLMGFLCLVCIGALMYTSTGTGYSSIRQLKKTQ